MQRLATKGTRPRRFLPQARHLLWPTLALSILLIVVPLGSQGAAPAPAATPAPVIQPGQPLQPGQVNLPSGVSQRGEITDPQTEQAKRNELRLAAHWLRFWAYFCVIVGGAFGGLIYGLSRNRGAVIPHFLRLQDGGNAASFQKLDLGFIGDMLIGIGGGIIVFNLVPQADSDIFESLFINAENFGKLASLLMKIAALSLIGGFAGISLFDEAAKRISRELEEVRSQAEANSSLINQLQSVEAEIQYLLNPLVDPSFPPLNESQKDAFKKLMLKAPLNLRNKVFERLQNAYNSHLISVNDTQLTPAEIKIRLNLQECLMAGFDALIAAADEQEQKNQGKDVNKHRYYAHKGFIHDQLAVGSELLGLQAGQHWLQGEEDLSQAIQLRDQIPPDRENYWFYNLERLLCRFKLRRRDEVIAELNSEMVQRWVHKQPGIVNANLKLLPSEFLEFLKSEWKDKPHWNELFSSAAAQPPVVAEPSPNGHGAATTVTTAPPVPAPPPTPGAPVVPAPAPTLSTGAGPAGSTTAPPPTPVPGVGPTAALTALQRIRQGGSL